MKKNHDYLRKEFHKETGKQSFRTQFDADIEYVVWLEAKIISFSSVLSDEVCGKCEMLGRDGYPDQCDEHSTMR